MVMIRAASWLPITIRLVQGLLLVGCGFALLRAIRPPTIPLPDVAFNVEATTQSATPTIESRPLSWYAPIWERDLRRPPVAPPPPTPQRKRIPEPEPLRLALLGTMVESGDRYAVFRDEQGRILVKGVDDAIDRFIIARIDRGRAELVEGERRVAVTVPGYDRLQTGEVR